MALTKSEVAATWMVNDWIDCGQSLDYIEARHVFDYERKMAFAWGGIEISEAESFPTYTEIQYLLAELREAGATRESYSSLVRARDIVMLARAREEAEEEAYNAS